MTESSMKTLNPAVARVLKRLHYPLDVILTCVRWYVAYPLSLNLGIFRLRFSIAPLDRLST